MSSVARETVVAVSFWVAALFPFVYLPVFLLGSTSTTGVLTLLTLISINVVALIVGHDYGVAREESNTTRSGSATPRGANRTGSSGTGSKGSRPRSQ